MTRRSLQRELFGMAMFVFIYFPSASTCYRFRRAWINNKHIEQNALSLYIHISHSLYLCVNVFVCVQRWIVYQHRNTCCFMIQKRRPAFYMNTAQAKKRKKTPAPEIDIVWIYSIWLGFWFGTRIESILKTKRTTTTTTTKRTNERKKALQQPT